MKKELDEQLCKDFPHLYGDRSKSMRETCMSWGFDVSDGWFKPIYDLSLKLEALIVKYIEDNKGELYCRYCTRKEKEHTKFYTFTSDGKTTISLGSEEGLSKEDVFSCDGFEANYPRASQVKEKFGGLRFYMTASSNEMEELIGQAEKACAALCEDCGKPGEECTDGWVRTLCPACVDRYNHGFDDGYGFRVRQYIQCSKLKELKDNGNEEEKSSEEGSSSNEKEENGKEG